MKTVLKVLGGIILALVLGFVGLMIYGKSTAHSAIADYFAAAKTASAADLQATFHPGLVEGRDPQLLAAFVQQLLERYGAFVEVETANFQFSDNLNNGVRTQSYSGTMVFERGEVPLKMSFIDDMLAGITIEDETIGQEVLVASMVPPPDLAVYQAQGEQFWRAAAGGSAAEAFAMMAPPLQKMVGEKAFSEKIQQAFAGKSLEDVRYVGSTDDEATDKIRLQYKLTIDGAQLDAETTVQFARFRGHLVGYDLGKSER